MPHPLLSDPLPPTHNPLIGALHKDTLNNIRDSLCTLQEITSIPNEVMMSDRSTTGLYFLMTCILDALQFEIEYRE